jgi:MYXO-CTERM domain-containing protein
MKQLHVLAAALSAIALALAAGSANAQIVNGNFANGLEHWTTVGDASASGANSLWLTTAEATEADDANAGLFADGARNVSGNDPLQVGGGTGSLEQFVGVPLGAFDPDPANFVYATEGSAASQTFTAAAGSELSFQWDMGTLDQRNDPTLADVAFVVIDGQVITLADDLAATTPTTLGGNLAHTGWMDFSTTLAGAGQHMISFGIVDVTDEFDTSTLAVTSVNVSAVPETSPLALMAAGLGLLALQRRRRST